MLTVALAAAIVDIFLILFKGAAIDVPSYAALTAFSLGVAGFGMAYRLSKRNERIASALICTGAFLFFSMCLSLFNYLLLPVSRPVLDPMLAEIDALFGYHWPTVMQLAADNLIVSEILKYAYMSTIPQFATLVIILGLSGRLRDLHVMITSVTITATASICFWGIFPTLGTTTMYALPQEIWDTVRPIVDQEYARELIEVATKGPGLITPEEVRGLIGFPSYHAALAFTAAYAARNVRFLGPIFLVLNLLILPAIFVHGGHHLMDAFGGLAVFVLGTWAATRAVHANYRRHAIPAIVAE